LSPNSPYAKTKILAEKYLTKYFKENSWILRFAPVYSNQFKLNIERRTKIKNRFYKVGDGTNKLSLLNIKNISYIIKEIIADKIPPDIYNLADTQIYDYDGLLKNRGASNVLSIPKFIPIFAYYIGKLTNNIFLLENSVKLISDNIYSTKKLQKYTQLPFTIKNY